MSGEKHLTPTTKESQPLSVLIIEDDAVSRRMLERILADAQFHTLSAENGQIGLEVWQSRQPDLVLLDLEMPEMNGLEWLQQVQSSLTLTQSVILITAHEDLDTLKACFELGIQTLLRKPVNRFELLGVVTRAAQFIEMARELETRNRLLESTFAQIKGGLMRVANDFTVELLSTHGAHLLDTSTKEVQAKPLSSLFAKGFSSMEQLLQSVQGQGNPVYDHHFKWSLHSGRVIPAQISIFPLVGPGPEGGWLLQFVDLQAEERLQLERYHGVSFGRMIGASPPMKHIYRLIDRIAPTTSSVLIQGESGTGKELAAREIHDRSNRAQGPFHAVNCAAISANLMESEFFGHESGAYTGASGRKQGRLELAHRGTLFLDEIGELPLELQGKLLRALEERCFERVGGTKTVHVDLRVIAATNRDLQTMVTRGEFRSDLYYRLQVFPIILPPLRQRTEDLPLLISWFIKELNRKTSSRIQQVSPETMNHLLQYNWPGNIRELLNTLEYSFAMASGSTISMNHLPKTVTTAENTIKPAQNEAPSVIPTSERELILQTLAKTSYRKAQAAKLLGIHPTTLSRKLKKHGI